MTHEKKMLQFNVQNKMQLYQNNKKKKALKKNLNFNE